MSGSSSFLGLQDRPHGIGVEHACRNDRCFGTSRNSADLWGRPV